MVNRIALAAVLAQVGCGSGSNGSAFAHETPPPAIVVGGACTNTPDDCGVKVCVDCTANAPPGTEPACVASKCVFPCAVGFHACGANCVPDDDADACGASCTVCTAPLNGVPACTAGACDFTCRSGFAKGASACRSRSFSVSY